jgi:hypothetical protein
VDCPNVSTDSVVAKSMKTLLVWFSLTMLTACQSASSGAQQPVSAGNLTKEYDESSAGVRSKYDGKEITVRGYTLIAATMPRPGDDQGSVLLEEKGRDPGRQVACWFSKEQAAEFSKIKGGQYVTVKGVFNGEAGAELKFCKLVKVE